VIVDSFLTNTAYDFLLKYYSGFTLGQDSKVSNAIVYWRYTRKYFITRSSVTIALWLEWVVAVLQEQRTSIACTVMGIELLGSKVEFCWYCLLHRLFCFWFSWIYNAQIVKGAKFHLYQKN
jgi:hypothetical protein